MWTGYLAQSAAGADKLAGDPLGVVGSQEGGDTGNVIDLADAAEGRLRNGGSLEVGTDEARGVYALGFIGSAFEATAVAQTPLGRIGQVDDIATVATFLASNDSRWITGELVRAGGGLR